MKTPAQQGIDAAKADDIARAKVKRIRMLEDKARQIQVRMDKIRNEWESLLEDLSESPVWSADCEARGLVTNPTFNDTLC